VSLSLSVISTSLAKPCCTCFNLSVGVTLNVRFTTNRMCRKSNTRIYAARIRNGRVSIACDLYCWFCHSVKLCITRDDQYLLYRLDIRQDSEFTTGYVGLYPKTAFKREPVSSEISDFCVISELLLFLIYFACQSERIKFDNYFFVVCCAN